MRFTGEFDIDEILSEVEQALMDSSSFDRHVSDLVENLVTDQIAEAIERIDIDEIGDFERRSEEIARDVVSEITDDLDAIIEGKVREQVEFAMTDAPDPQDADDRITNLEQTVEALTETVNRLTDALAAAALLMGAVVKG